MIIIMWGEPCMWHQVAMLQKLIVSFTVLLHMCMDDVSLHSTYNVIILVL